MREPPSDAADLAELPVARLDYGWRVFRAAHSPVFYFRGPSRFVPVSPNTIGVLHLADSPRTALIETFQGRQVLARDEVETWALVRVSLARLRFADATDVGAARLGLGPEVSLTPDYGLSQRWAAALVDAAFDGIVYRARHSPSGRLIAVFGEAGSTGPPRLVAEPSPIPQKELEALGVHVVPVPADGRCQLQRSRMKPPLLFVSYSHDSRDHQEWVRAVFVNGLRSRAVDARMDVYELSYGDKIDAFMETFIEDCDHIAAICTPITAGA